MCGAGVWGVNGRNNHHNNHNNNKNKPKGEKKGGGGGQKKREMFSICYKITGQKRKEEGNQNVSTVLQETQSRVSVSGSSVFCQSYESVYSEAAHVLCDRGNILITTNTTNKP